MRVKFESLILEKLTFKEICQIQGIPEEDADSNMVIALYAYNLMLRYKSENINADVTMCYDFKNLDHLVIVFRRLQMKAEFLIEIPYGCRSKYKNTILKLNSLVGENGMVTLAVNNNPYALESILLIRTDENIEEIKEEIRQAGLKTRHDKGLKEIIMEMGNRRWNTADIRISETESELENLMNFLYAYEEQDSLVKKGYTEKQFFKKRLFVSYSHKDEVVSQIIEKLRTAGINIWIDIYDIEIGEPIVRRMMEGLFECDMAVFFLSHNFAKSQMTKGELNNYFEEAFTGKKKWFPVKLDDVDVNEILPGLSRYKYYDFEELQDIDALVADIKRVMGK